MKDDEARARTARIIEALHASGRAEAAHPLRDALARKTRDAFLLTLREACETVLTMVEAIDPATETLLEELRADVDAWLTPPRKPPLKPPRGPAAKE